MIKNTFAAILVDVNLPDMNGLELSRRIRASPVRQPAVILCTATEPSFAEFSAASAESDGFLTLPVQIEHIAAVLQGAIKKRRSKEAGQDRA